MYLISFHFTLFYSSLVFSNLPYPAYCFWSTPSISFHAITSHFAPFPSTPLHPLFFTSPYPTWLHLNSFLFCSEREPNNNESNVVRLSLISVYGLIPRARAVEGVDPFTSMHCSRCNAAIGKWKINPGQFLATFLWHRQRPNLNW